MLRYTESQNHHPLFTDSRSAVDHPVRHDPLPLIVLPLSFFVVPFYNIISLTRVHRARAPPLYTLPRLASYPSSPISMLSINISAPCIIPLAVCFVAGADPAAAQMRRAHNIILFRVCRPEISVRVCVYVWASVCFILFFVGLFNDFFFFCWVGGWLRLLLFHIALVECCFQIAIATPPPPHWLEWVCACVCV